MLDIVTAIYSLMGRNTVPSFDTNTTQEHVDRIFEVNLLILILYKSTLTGYFKLDINADTNITL